jgi:SAM-dependent methyltransferase
MLTGQSDSSSTNALWNQAYHDALQTEERSEPSDFAVLTATRLGPDDTVMELGCGVGVDAALYASKAKSVVAVDFAEEPIEMSKAAFGRSNMKFQVLDISKELGRYRDASKSAIIARRSLHYFDDATTKRIFREIGRILTHDGQLFFEVKSNFDPHANQAPNDGEVRHFFSTFELPILLPGFEIESVEKPAQDFFGYDSVFLTCWARRAYDA